MKRFIKRVAGVAILGGCYCAYQNFTFTDPMRDILDGRLAVGTDPSQLGLGGYPVTAYSATGTKEPHALLPPLDTHRTDIVDVCVIGGGLAGLHTALALAEKKKKCVVLEASRVGSGASGRNGGDAIIGFHVEADELGRLLGEAKARTLYSHAVLGYTRLKRIIADYKIQCGAAEDGALTCIFTSRVEKDGVPLPTLLAQEQQWIDEQKAKYDEHLVLWDKATMARHGLHSDRYAYGIFNPRNLALNPLELVLGIARACRQRGVTIHEASPVVNCVKAGDHFVVTTTMGSVKARDVVVATASAPPLLYPKLALCTTPLYTAMMLTKPLPTKVLDAVMSAKVAVFDERFALAYFRRVPGDKLLFGSLASALPMQRADYEQELRMDLLKTFPSLAPYLAIESSWQGRLDARYPIFPMIGWDEGGSGVWYSLGFSGHGLVPTCAAGELLASAIASIPEKSIEREPTDTRYKLWAEVTLSPVVADPKTPFVPPALPPLLGPFGSLGSSIFCFVLSMTDRLARRD